MKGLCLKRSSARGIIFLAMLLIAAVPGCDTITEDSEDKESSSNGNLVFTSSLLYTGDLKTEGGGATGLEGADNICNLLAEAADLEGTWVAWLSDSTVNAIDRVTDDGPWYLTDGVSLAFNNSANLATNPEVAVHLDEFGREIPVTPNQIDISPLVWTGTVTGGGGSGLNCADWSASDGSGSKGWSQDAITWTESSGDSVCTTEYRLYCFQQ